MVIKTNIKVDKTLLQELSSVNVDVDFKLPVNKPSGDFFYDPWDIKEEFKGTVWERLLNVLPNNIGEARLIKLTPGQAYRSHADIDDRYHFNITGEKSFVIYTDLNTIYPQEQTEYWYEMDAGPVHSAVNTGRVDRIQFVVRKLLLKNSLKNPITIKITLLEDAHDWRYQFDAITSVWLNKANKEGTITNFKWDGEQVQFDIEENCINDLKANLARIFNVEIIR
jgi:hypothetical protein